MPNPIRLTVDEVDLSQRFQQTTAVTGSPAAAAETIIATLNLNTDLAIVAGVQLWGNAAFTVGTSGTAVRLRLRRTNVAGTVVADSGALTGGVAAAALLMQDIQGFDTGATSPAFTYVMTLQVTAGAAASTVSAVQLAALII